MSFELPRILVVDDEPRAVELLVRSLRKQARVDTAQSGEEALTSFGDGDFSLVISDQRMPGMAGVDLLGRIADCDENVVRILLTGYADLEATVEAINRGRVHAYLHKPCSPPDLRATVKGVLDRVELARENTRLLVSLRERNQELDQALSSLASAQVSVVASERLAAIGKMSAMIVHDLRSPLTVLLGLGRHVRELSQERGSVEFGEVSAEIEEEVMRMQRMCEELLEVTRASEGGATWAHECLDEVVAAALASFVEPAATQGVEVGLQLESGVELEVDEDGLRRALSNLVTNALQAMPEGGLLHVETALEGDEAVVRIRDTGVGIPDDIADRLFEPFVTSGRRGGTGLGLAIAQKVAHDHRGAIEVGKPEGGGTVFTLKLSLRRHA